MGRRTEDRGEGIYLRFNPKIDLAALCRIFGLVLISWMEPVVFPLRGRQVAWKGGLTGKAQGRLSAAQGTGPARQAPAPPPQRIQMAITKSGQNH